MADLFIKNLLFKTDSENSKKTKKQTKPPVVKIIKNNVSSNSTNKNVIYHVEVDDHQVQHISDNLSVENTPGQVEVISVVDTTPHSNLALEPLELPYGIGNSASTSEATTNLKLNNVQNFVSDFIFQDSSPQNTDLQNESIAKLLEVFNKCFNDLNGRFEKFETNTNKQLGELNSGVGKVHQDFKALKKETEKDLSRIAESIENVQFKISSVLREKLTDFISIQDFEQKYNLVFPVQTIEDFNEFEINVKTNQNMLEDLKKLFESNLISVVQNDKEKEAKDNMKTLIRKLLTDDILENFNAQREDPKTTSKNTAKKKSVQRYFVQQNITNCS